MNNQIQVHTGGGDNLQSSTKYENVKKVSVVNGKQEKKRSFAKLGFILFVFLFVLLSPFWTPLLCPLLQQNDSIFQAIRSLNIGPINGSELCKMTVNP